MTSDRIKILQVSDGARLGGAERMAVSLHEGLQRRGQSAWMAVARRVADDPDIFLIPTKPPGGPWARSLRFAGDGIGTFSGRMRGASRFQRGLRMAESPSLFLDWWRGREHFNYPGTATIPDLPPQRPDVIHCHNLHGGYFDLRQLGRLSRVAPVVLTLHDEWSFTGHCACTMSCERWRVGCGSCPDLTIYPAVRRDATHDNWRVKRAVYTDSRLYVSTPSRWLMDRARDSILAEGAARWRVIANGVDRSIFRPADRAVARDRLALPQEPLTLLFAASGARSNMFKDYRTVSLAVRNAAKILHGRTLLLIVLGDGGPAERFENLEIRFVPYESDLRRVAAYYQAADIYLHGATAEAAGLTILEGLATGLPVIATAVGGISESVRSLAGAPGGWSGTAHPVDRATGVLVAPADAEGMAAATATLLGDEPLRLALSANAAADAANRFDLDRYVDTTLEWYREILADWRTPWRSLTLDAGRPHRLTR